MHENVENNRFRRKRAFAAGWSQQTDRGCYYRVDDFRQKEFVHWSEPPGVTHTNVSKEITFRELNGSACGDVELYMYCMQGLFTVARGADSQKMLGVRVIQTFFHEQNMYVNRLELK